MSELDDLTATVRELSRDIEQAMAQRQALAQPMITLEAEERVREDFARIGDVFSRMAEAFAEVFRPLFAHIAESVKTVYSALYQAYLNAGAPYGETEAGMLVWLQEQVKDQKARGLLGLPEQEAQP
jgi:chorismate mutase